MKTMKKMLIHKIAGIVIIGAAMVGCSKNEANRTSGHHTIRVMSYNIRYDNPDDGINTWNNRKERVVNVIRFNNVDIIGMQEAEYQQVTYLDEQLGKFDWSGVGRSDGKRGGEFSPVFYNAKRLEQLNNGTFWLSQTPGEPGKSWDAALPRIVSWVQLKEKETGKEFFFFNTHFDHIGEQARKESARLILQKIAAIAGEKIPVILSGDFNVPPGSEPYAILAETLKDAFHAGKYPHYGPVSTFMEEGDPFYVGSGNGGRRIDYIFTNSRVEVVRHGIIGTFRDGRFPSDHLPVLAVVTF